MFQYNLNSIETHAFKTITLQQWKYTIDLLQYSYTVKVALPYMVVSARQVGDGRVRCTRGKRFYFTPDRHLAAVWYLFQNRV